METSIRAVARLATALAVVALVAPAAAQHIASSRGEVEIGRGIPVEWHAASVGEALLSGDSIRTGADGRAELALPEATLRLFPRSLLKLPANAFDANGVSRNVELEEGQSIFDIDKRALEDPFQVHTPEAVVTVKGTRFSVGVEATLATVSVFEGLVGVQALTQAFDREMLVRPGFTAVGGSDRAFELILENTPDPWNDWGSGKALLKSQARDTGAFERRAVERAAKLARARSKPAVVEQAMRRNPAMRRRIEKRVAAMTAEKLAGQAPPAAIDPASDDVLQADARRHHGRLAPNPDAIVDSPLDEADHALVGEYFDYTMEEMTGSPPPPDPGGGFKLLDANVVSSGPGVSIYLYDASGTNVGVVTMNDMQMFLQTADPTLLPSALQTNWSASGLPLLDYMQLLMSTL